jgi:superoxide reductase
MSDAAPMDMQHVTDFATAGDFEKKHTPYVTLEKLGERTRVSVEVGHEVAHPNGPDHYITFIELYAEAIPLARFDFSPQTAFPNVSVIVALPVGTAIRAIEHCNLHGFWSYEVRL